MKIEFIVVDDEPKVLEYVQKDIHSEMDKTKFDYSIKCFSKYNDDFFEKTKDNETYKIYFLDIDVYDKSGIDVSNHIRTYNLNSPIIFLTFHNDMADTVAKETILPLMYINKYHKVHFKIKKAVKIAISMLGTNQAIRFITNKTEYLFKLDDILYIEKQKNSKYCIVHTNYAIAPWKITIAEALQYLNKDFVKTHQSCIINNNRAIIKSKTNKIIKFDTGEEIDLISDIYDKEKEPVCS